MYFLSSSWYYTASTSRYRKMVLVRHVYSRVDCCPPALKQGGRFLVSSWFRRARRTSWIILSALVVPWCRKSCQLSV